MVNYLTAPRTGVHVRKIEGVEYPFQVWNGVGLLAAYPTYKAAAYHATYMVHMQGLDPAEILNRHVAAIVAAREGTE